MIIRNYQPTDRAACLRIFKSNSPQFFDSSELRYLHNWLTAKDSGYMAWEDHRDEAFFVIEAEGAVVGCGGYAVDGDASRTNLVWGMVQREFQGKGYGAALLRYRLGTIRRLFPESGITLDTTQHCAAFFERNGFRLKAVKPDFYGPGLHRHDMIYAV